MFYHLKAVGCPCPCTLHSYHHPFLPHLAIPPPGVGAWWQAAPSPHSIGFACPCTLPSHAFHTSDPSFKPCYSPPQEWVPGGELFHHFDRHRLPLNCTLHTFCHTSHTFHHTFLPHLVIPLPRSGCLVASCSTTWTSRARLRSPPRASSLPMCCWPWTSCTTR